MSTDSFTSLVIAAVLVLVGCGSDSDVLQIPADSSSTADADTASDDSSVSDDTLDSELPQPDAETSPPDTSPADTGVPDSILVDSADAPPACTPVDVEPNDTMSTAIARTGIDDCDSSGGTLTGVLESATDVDYFKYAGKDAVGCTVDATIRGPVSSPLTYCVFARCSTGVTTWKSCISGGKTTVSGMDGCCGVGSAQLDYSCSTISDDSATIWMSVSQKGTAACVPYSATYHF